MNRLSFAVAALLGAVTALGAQAPQIKPEFRPFAGLAVPTGDQRDLFDNTGMLGLQVAAEFNPTLHLVGTFTWVPGHANYTVAGPSARVYGYDVVPELSGEYTTAPAVNLFTYDVGMEMGWAWQLNGDWELRPFVGTGVGGRTYVYSAEPLSDQTCPAAYGAVGTEIQHHRVAFRIEARGHVFAFRSPVPGAASENGNDLAFTIGLAYHTR
jgi:hypothetical protein